MDQRGTERRRATRPGAPSAGRPDGRYRPLPYRKKTQSGEPPVIVPSIVLMLCGAVALVGGVAELVDTVRTSRAPVSVGGTGSDVPHQAVEDVGRWPLLAWFGLAAFTVLGAASIAEARPEIFDLTFAVLLLGFAGERSFYLVRRRRSGGERALGAEILALVVGAIGLLVGVTL